MQGAVRVELLLFEAVVKVADASLQRQVWRAEHHCARHQTAQPRVLEPAHAERNPVEVVGAPVTRKRDASLDDALLLRRVEPDAVEQTQLEPGRVGVAVRHSGLKPVPVECVQVVQLRLIGVTILAEPISELLVLSFELLCEIEAQDSIFPLFGFFLERVGLHFFNYNLGNDQGVALAPLRCVLQHYFGHAGQLQSAGQLPDQCHGPGDRLLLPLDSQAALQHRCLFKQGPQELRRLQLLVRHEEPRVLSQQ